MKLIARSPKQIGACLRWQRRELGLNQAEVGSKTKFQQATISRAEAGDEGIRLSTLCDILAALNLELVVRPRTKGSEKLFEDLF